MLHIKFEYQDEYTGDNWSQQECILPSLEKCKEIYGLNEIKYRILSVEEVK